MKNLSTRLHPGQKAPPFTIPTLSHGALTVPGAGALIHLQFRRFAGCPICSLHLRSFARRYDDLKQVGITEVTVFHSGEKSLRRYHADLPFIIVPDEHKRLYALYGLERSLSAMMHPASMWAAMRGMVTAPNNPLDAAGGYLGLPADFLIGPSGDLLHTKYGAHADDHWEVEDVLRFADGAGFAG
jgi:peroxiredoxin